MHVADIQICDSPARPEFRRLTADISYEDEPGAAEPLWFDVPAEFGDSLTTSGDPWIVALLPLACKFGEPLHINGIVDSVLYENLREIMEWWRFWYPDMQVVDVVPKEISKSGVRTKNRSAQFFSGGVDSFFTLLRQSDNPFASDVDDLLFGWGFDIPLGDPAAFGRASSMLNNAADSLGKKLVTFSSNIRETRFCRLPWGEIGHGNAMAAVALLMQDAYDRVLIPSTDGYRETGPWGSHATVDHYYSTTALRLIHEGAAFTRFQKVKLVAESEPALTALRVCWRSQGDANCGKCEKCVRTMIALELRDSLADAGSFDNAALDLSLVRRVYCPYTKIGSFRLYYREMRDEAISLGRLDIARSISSALRRSLVKQPLLFVTERLRWNRYLKSIGAPLDQALRRTLIE